jgi:hypothetical protein
MKEEVGKILRMVEEGKLSAEEAEKLLSAMDAPRSPGAGVGISFGRKRQEEFVEKELPGRDDFKLALSASKAELMLWDQDTVKAEIWLDDLGSAEETPEGLVLNMARAKIHLPAGRSVKLEISAGTVEGEVPAITMLYCSAGKAELRGMREGVVSCNAGKAEVHLAPEPGPLSVEANAGKVELLVHGERKMHVLREEVNACGVFVDGEIEDSSAPQAIVRCNAGKVTITRAR